MYKLIHRTSKIFPSDVKIKCLRREYFIQRRQKLDAIKFYIQMQNIYVILSYNVDTHLKHKNGDYKDDILNNIKWTSLSKQEQFNHSSDQDRKHFDVIQWIFTQDYWYIAILKYVKNYRSKSHSIKCVRKDQSTQVHHGNSRAGRCVVRWVCACLCPATLDLFTLSTSAQKFLSPGLCKKAAAVKAAGSLSTCRASFQQTRTALR